MKKYSLEFVVGVFILIGLLCLGYMSIKLGKMELFSKNGYTLTATFNSINGLKTGASVEIAGIPVGKVSGITLDTNDFSAQVTMTLREDIRLTDDSIASIKTSGIIGDKYINISIGAGSPIASGGNISETESAIDLENLISKYVFGGVK